MLVGEIEKGRKTNLLSTMVTDPLYRLRAFWRLGTQNTLKWDTGWYGECIFNFLRNLSF